MADIDPQMLANALRNGFGDVKPQSSMTDIAAALKSDPKDFTGRYNTPLDQSAQNQYNSWVQEQSSKLGRNVGNDLYDYDLQGWYAKNGAQSLDGAHLTDQWKKPNHPTFSDQSQYSGVDGYAGGKWAQGQGNSWQYMATPSNLYSPDELKQYFNKYEPSSALVLPQNGN